MAENIFKIKRIKEIPYYFAEHCFGFFIVLALLAMVCGGFIFYRYNVMPKSQQVENLDALLKFEEETYQEILQTWEAREQKIEQSEFKQYPSLFQREQKQEIESLD